MAPHKARSVVARRIVTLFFLAAFIPLAILSAITAHQLDVDQKDQIDAALKKDAKAVTIDVHLRLELAIEQLLLMAQMSTSESRNSASARFLSVEEVSSLTLEKRGFTSSASVTLLRETALLVLPASEQSKSGYRLFLATMLSDRPQSTLLVAELDSSWLWENSNNSGELVCVFLSLTNSFVHCNQAVDTQWQQLALSEIQKSYINSFVNASSRNAFWSLDEQLIIGSPRLTSVTSTSAENTVAQLGDFAKTLLQVIALTLFVIALASLRTIRSTMKPLNTLMSKTEALSRGELGTRITLDTGDEFESLGSSFNNMATKLGQQLENQSRLANLGDELQKQTDLMLCHPLVGEALKHLSRTGEAHTIFSVTRDHQTTTFHWNMVAGLTEEMTGENQLHQYSSVQLDSAENLEKYINLKFISPEKYLVVPGFVEGRVISLYLAPATFRSFDNDLTHFVQQVGNLHATAITNQLLTQHLGYQANHDYLTGLPNRMFLRNEVDALFEKNSDQPMVVSIFDIDRFKVINDTMGHAAGDDLLVAIAKRLNDNLPEGVISSRFAGDEFILLDSSFIETPTKQQVMTRVISPIQKTFETPFLIANNRFRVKASIGVAFSTQDGRDFTSLLKNADLAMYEAKRTSPGGYCFNSLEIQRAIATRYDLEAALSNVIASGQLRMQYQPIINVSTREVVGSEALMRWFKPDGGQNFPDEFIPIAEDTGHIIEIGEWALTESCKMMKRALEGGLPLKMIAVNVSGVQLGEPNYVTSVVRALDNSGLEASYLELEITETSLVEDLENIILKLVQLRTMGIKISIDDFGTGFSSLQYLKRLPADKLKIDQMFIRSLPGSPDDLAIVRTIIALGRELDLDLLAEGCETPEQEKMLQEESVQYVQGWLYSKALEEKEFLDYASANRIN